MTDLNSPPTNITHPTSSEAVALLEEIQKLMELKGENPFKIRAFEKAIQQLTGRHDLHERANNKTLTELPGIGKGISEVLTDFLIHGRAPVRDELLKSIPAGLLELTQIPGLGPKKAMVLIEELGIHSIAELEYACRENRLCKLKGFGEKVQQKIMEGLLFHNASQGQQKLSDAFPWAENFLKFLVNTSNGLRVSETGSLRRRLEILDKLEFLVEVPEDPKLANPLRTKIQNAVALHLDSDSNQHLPVKIHYAPTNRFGYELARTTATDAHWTVLKSPKPFEAAQEEDFYSTLKLPMIPPETRETGEEVRFAQNGKLSQILPWKGVRGVFHNHTTRSDGTATLEEMVVEAKRLGYEYIGISDHSQTAFYAQGLKLEDLKSQKKELQQVQEKHPEIRIFWGIESDILADGSLDYEAKVLENFDFVIASVHSRFKMDKETMTNRILEAIRNPHTRFLGHATGRLLLGRKGYELDMEKIIEEAAKHDVAIEINANPARLDIDWRWGPELRKHSTFVSINPDAHEISGLSDTLYGIAMARKALLPSSLVVNSRSTQEIEKWLRRA